MAIKNASDLLVYTKTSATKQVTRIKALTNAPFSVWSSPSKKGVKVNNITQSNGVIINDHAIDISSNAGASIVENAYFSTHYSTIGTTQTDGDYTYRDYENGATGIVPTLEIVSGTGTLKDNAIIIEIITPGSSEIFDPVAFSTQASFSTNMDLRDVTTKDSEGWSESVGGLKSFEVSTELLQTLNPDHPIDGTDFINKLKERSLVNVSFSDRIRNILINNTVAAGQDGFTLNTASETTGQGDPFSGTTASYITASATSESRLQCNFSASRLEDKKLTWSFYVKQGSTGIATIRILNVSRDDYTARIISGSGSIAALGSEYYKITGLNTNWTRIAIEFKNPIDVTSGESLVEFRLYPDVYNSQTTSKSIYTSSWQFEQRQSVTDYQDPTKVNRWQGDALVTSVSFDAGVEDNLTCSATFTGTATNTYNT